MARYVRGRRFVRRWLALGLGLAVGSPVWPGRSAGPEDRPGAEVAPLRADVRVVFWYDRERPLETFRYQPYDLRKGEYTPEVGLWLARMKARHPGYAAYARDVVLARERGETEKHRIGSAVLREFLLLGESRGYDFGGAAPGRPAPPSAFARPPNPTTPRPGAAVPPGPNPAVPFPVPFPRPHP